jgi:alpha-glucosidase
MFLYGTGKSGFRADFPGVVTRATPMRGSEDRNQDVTFAKHIAETRGTRSFPWRLAIITADDRKIIESELVYLLARDNQIGDTSWIKPGKVAWDWYNANNIYGVDFKSGLNTETYKYYIDFASRYGLEYVILDEGWSKTTTNILAPNPDLDVKALIAYGREKNVRIILWTLWGPLDKDYENILATWASWGVAGIKVDFMQRADQYMVNFYEKIAREAAKHKLLVDYHGGFKPSGHGRTYPQRALARRRQRQ